MMPPASWCCSSISRISLTENTPMTTTMNWMPSDRCTSPPVKRYTPELESRPTVDSERPSTAASTAFIGASPIRPVMQAKAKHISAKYSAGPKARAQRASRGAKSTMPMVATSEPTKELQAEIDSATPPCPLRAMG
jgi:hypothetical protein